MDSEPPRDAAPFPTHEREDAGTEALVVLADEGENAQLAQQSPQVHPGIDIPSIAGKPHRVARNFLLAAL